jgi:uncharacterized membrane protein YqjE
VTRLPDVNQSESPTRVTFVNRTDGVLMNHAIFELRSPRRLLALVGLIMIRILFAFAQNHSSALAAILIVGAILITGFGVWSLSRGAKSDNRLNSSEHEMPDFRSG